LEDGIASINRDLTLLDVIFLDQYGLSQAEVAKIKEFWQASPPKVAHGFAHASHTFPLWSIVLGAEGEKIEFVGDEAGDCLDEDDPDYLEDIRSSIWEHNYRILTYAEHPDVTLYYYEIAKTILLLAHDYFVTQHLFEIHVTGRDMMPDPKYLPDHLFVRELNWACQRELLQVDRGSRLRKAFRVSGIHIDKSGSPSDVGDVETRVIPYTE
jgi:hypothetical protein